MNIASIYKSFESIHRDTVPSKGYRHHISLRVSLQKAKKKLLIDVSTEIMVLFCYQRLCYYTETLFTIRQLVDEVKLDL